MSSGSSARRKRSSGSEPAPGAGLAVRFLKAWWPVLLVEAGILFMSSRSIGQPTFEIPHLDKAAHFVEYAALGALLYRALRLSGLVRPTALLATIVLGAVFGAWDEYFQSFVPGRDSSLFDWMADVAGSAAGAMVARLLEHRVPAGWIRPPRGPISEGEG